MKFRQFAAFFQKLLFPCPGCGEERDMLPGTFCESCLAGLPRIPDDENCCSGCGGIHDGALAVCSRCLAEPPRPWKNAVAALEYRDCGREIIRRFKFGNMPELSRPLGNILAERALQKKLTADLIVPVPLHRLRYWSRGYNQSELLAQMVGKILNIPVTDVLKRRVPRSQHMRNRRERHAELNKAFALKRNCSVSGRDLLLLDDVLTTGATLHAAADVLLKSGAASVTVLVLSRTPGSYQSSFR